MVKQFHKINRAETHSDDDEELSDLEINDQEKVLEQEINDVEALETITKRIKDDFHKLMKSEKVDWLETMDLTAEQPINADLNTDDDIRRELIFYNISLQNAAKGINNLKHRNQKLNRPEDFFAEMMKSDVQMQKVKKQIITEQIRIKKFSEKKQKMQNIKFAKSMKHETGKQKGEFKKKTREGLESWKKHIKNNPNDYDKIDDFFDGDENRGRKNKKQFGKFGKSERSGKFDNKDNFDKSNKFNQTRNNKNTKRPGKVKRMIQRNKKNSKKHK